MTAITELHIKELIRKAEAKTATLAEIQELLDWIGSEEGLENIQLVDEVLGITGIQEPLNLTETVAHMNIDGLVDEVLAADKLQHLGDPRITFKNNNKGSNLYNWKRAAAILLLFIGIGAVFFMLIQKDKHAAIERIARVQPDETIHSGTDKAMLTLDNGKTIVLDNTGNGVIADQPGVNIHKVENGQLVYAVDKLQNLDNSIHFNTMTTPRGGRYKIVLPDGTKVWLNAASTLTYPTRFLKDSRIVTMHGEAYFEVAKNALKPFIVKTDNQMEVKVYGTHFNIQAYDDNAGIKTTLFEGSVKVSSAGGAMMLKPGQESSMDGAGNLKHTSNVNLEQAIAWKEGLFYFSDQNIKSIMQTISRWYDVDIHYEGAVPGDLFSAIITRDNNIHQILNMLEATGKVHFRITGKTVTVHS
ncbi:MAG TPA: FecR family protein [Arachidicoccus sp.]|nr:FecR family protein [Arachidicoccus sp.]